MDKGAIGVFDSGLGGLSILREIRQQLPHESILYFADQAHVPYGPRPSEQIRLFSEEITRFLLAQNAKAIIVACNTASAAALKYLRKTFPNTPFIGMEPAVKPAVKASHSGKIAVLATPATYQGALFASVVERFAKDAEIIQQTIPGLVSLIEMGNLNGKETYAVLSRALTPLLEDDIDTLVLGCTHYPFVVPLIERIVGPEVKIIDPSPAIARQTARTLDRYGLSASAGKDANLTFISSTDPDQLASMAKQLINETGIPQQAGWHGHRLELE